MPELKLSFHSTFALKKQDVLEILEAAAETNGLHDSMQSLIQRTGLGNKKVSPIKSWAVRAGLISNNALSPEGIIVRQYDPYLESPITEWLMHFYLSFGDRGLQPPPRDPAQWGGWPYFIFCFLPQYSAFTVDNLVQASTPIFETTPLTSLRENFRIVLRAYTERNALWSCRLISSNGNNHFERGCPQLPNLELIGYFLAQLWQRDFIQADHVTLNHLAEQPMGLAPILGVEPSKLLEITDRLHSHGLLQKTGTGWDAKISPGWQNPILFLGKAYQGGQLSVYT